MSSFALVLIGKQPGAAALLCLVLSDHPRPTVREIYRFLAPMGAISLEVAPF